MVQGRDAAPSSRRLMHIDVYRAIAILLVTGFHIWRPLGSDRVAIAQRSDFNLLGFLEHGHIGVELFFIISGYCMAFSSGVNGKSYIKYFFSRLVRIAPPYYAAIVFWNIALQFEFVRASRTPYDNLMHILFLHNFDLQTFHSISGVFWSLAVEMQYYVILPLLMPLLWSRSSAIALFLLSALLSIAINLLFDSKLLSWSLASYLVLFVFGAILSLHQSLVLKSHLTIFNFLMVFLIGFAITYVGKYSRVNELYDILIAVSLGYLLIVNRNFFDREAGNVWVRTLGFVGAMSYSVYLYNYIIYWPVSYIRGVAVAEWLLPAGMALLFGCAAYYLIEQPVNRLRKRYLN